MDSVRTCVGCRRRASKEDLIRLVVSSDVLVVDLKQIMPSRGAWLHPDQKCLAAAERSRAFRRALRLATDVDVSELDRYISNRGITAMDTQ